MHVVMLGVPQAVTGEWERTLHEAGARHSVECQVQHARGLEELPESLPPGLLVLWDAGGPVQHTLTICQRLHSRRDPTRSQLVVLTERGPDELDALDQAGADECLTPPGGRWGARLIALERRLRALEPSALVAGGHRKRTEATLQALLELTLAEPGPDFFQVLVRQLAQALDVTCALVGELDGDSVRKLACFNLGDFCELPPYALAGTPCQVTVERALCHYPDGVAARFPEDTMLHEQGLRSYLGAALKDSSGNPIGVLAVLNDKPLAAHQLDYALINAFAVRAGFELERRHQRDEMERSRDQLQKTLDTVPEPLLVKDRGYRWVAMNSAFCRLMGRPIEELLGRTDRDFYTKAEADTFRRQDEQVFTTGQPHESEDGFTDISGQGRTLVTRKALFTGGGRSLLMVLCRDITERKRLEAQLRMADRMVSAGTLATGVAHEINNPLTFVSANLTYLEEQLTEMMVMPEALPELREVLSETREGVGRIRELVQDLKSFARADDERSGPVDVHRVVDSALRLMRSALRHRTQVVRAFGEVPPVRGNESRLGQVLINLLVNALQALPPRTPDDNRIQVSTWREGPHHVVLQVEDNGQGIPIEIQRRIFEPFFTTKPVGVGTGLGLSICNTIVQGMGGRIEVRSQPGQGTAFQLRLPVDGIPAPLRGKDAVLPL
ncbi:two-component system sensor histidine kinase NtrB [Archangium lansingense]|uniref:histidine kinase n=1 Tax=Archangium lansingense TaxID=2995310 RepID=A0ABT3ZXR6_9BACT|nr:ATP-binding protein [Archangium lansinium]MCY1073539.1 ATP-binding protein [Archangium lansinium]